jgi:hypothetical protein
MLRVGSEAPPAGLDILAGGKCNIAEGNKGEAMKYPWVKKLVTVLLMIASVGGSGALWAKERRGAQLIIELKGGGRAAGELISVRNNSLLLLDAQGKDGTCDVAQIAQIRVVRISRGKAGAIIGFLAGGLALGIMGANSTEQDNGSGVSRILILGGIGGAISGGIGLGLGAALGHDKMMDFSGRSDAEIEHSLKKLRRYARVQGS